MGNGWEWAYKLWLWIIPENSLLSAPVSIKKRWITLKELLYSSSTRTRLAMLSSLRGLEAYWNMVQWGIDPEEYPKDFSTRPVTFTFGTSSPQKKHLGIWIRNLTSLARLVGTLVTLAYQMDQQLFTLVLRDEHSYISGGFSRIRND